MTRETTICEAFVQQSYWCERLGSPFMARLMAGLGKRLDRGSQSGRKVLDWEGPPDALGDAVPLRLAGALHALVRRGRLPELARLYPPYELPEIATLTDMALAAIDDADSEIAPWLDIVPQTNEVARSAILFPGLVTVAAQTALPLSLFEIGASAGLNLQPDKYAYRFGGTVLGLLGSRVLMAPQWSGPVPQGTMPVIAARRGCDRNPLDVTEDAHCERLMAYIWPDQPERLSRAAAAIDIARNDPPVIDAADADDWIDEVIGLEAESGIARVVYHSIAYQYFTGEAQYRIAERMQVAGETASKDAPLAWLAFEQFADQGPRLTLRLWPGGDERVLAIADAHVRNIQWLA